MYKIVWLRHSESNWNEEIRFAGWAVRAVAGQGKAKG